MAALGTLALLAACGEGGLRPPRLDAAGTGRVDSLALLRQELEHLRAVSAEKDTLLLQVRETQDFLDGIDAELARLAGGPGIDVAAPGEGIDTVGAQEAMRAGIRGRLQLLGERLARSEADARARAERVRQLAAQRALDAERIAELDSSVAHFMEIVRGQQEKLDGLLAQVEALERANAELAAERDVLADSVTRLVARGDSVFWHAGTRAALLDAGVAVEEGGRRVPLVGRVGRALVPARSQTSRAFTAIDRRRDREIALPHASRLYRIISSHDPGLLEPAQPGDPVVRGGTLRIADPERFWAQSRYLVLVEVDR